jgi:hypothetical protein
MKKVLVVLVVAVVLAAVGFGVWGYLKAQGTKEQNEKLEQITSDTTNLEPVNQSEAEISLSAWKNLSEQSSTIGDELEGITVVSGSLKENAGQFYGAMAQDKYKEAQYLQFLLEGQRKMGLKDAQIKTKGQIESTLKAFDELQSNLTQNDIALGPEYDTVLEKVEQEAATFRKSLVDLSDKMNYDSPGVQLSSAAFDKAMDELSQKIIESLNEFVDLQNKIRDEISAMTKANWVNPLSD